MEDDDAVSMLVVGSESGAADLVIVVRSCSAVDAVVVRRSGSRHARRRLRVRCSRFNDSISCSEVVVTC
eukprot:3324259-Prymnesium_polylepis.3